VAVLYRLGSGKSGKCRRVGRNLASVASQHFPKYYDDYYWAILASAPAAWHSPMPCTVHMGWGSCQNDGKTAALTYIMTCDVPTRGKGW